MAEYKVKMTVRSPIDGSSHVLTTGFAGCRDMMHAREKARTFYDVILIHWAKSDTPEPAKGSEEKAPPEGGLEM